MYLLVEKGDLQIPIPDYKFMQFPVNLDQITCRLDQIGLDLLGCDQIHKLDYFENPGFVTLLAPPVDRVLGPLPGIDGEVVYDSWLMARMVLELLELIQTQMAQKPMLRAEVGMRVRCANKASAE